MTDPGAVAPWWRRPAGAGAAAVALAVLAVGGYFGGTALFSSPSSPVASTPPPVAASRVPDYLPAGAVACKKVYDDVHRPFNAGARGTATTSCPFVEQVRRTYAQLVATSAPTDQIHAISPATEKLYVLACIPTGSYVSCTGGAAAVIYLYNDPPASP